MSELIAGFAPIIPLANGRILAGMIPGARLHVVDGGGHLFLLEEPGESARVIDQFLGESHVRAPGS